MSTQQCRGTIEGPDGTPGSGRRHPMWRRSCKNKTTHPSGYCHVHASLRPIEPDNAENAEADE